MVKILLYKISTYLKFFYNSKNHHGIHSPFVYNLVTKCFYDWTHKTEYDVLKAYRISLYQNKNFVEISEFGAGSQLFKSNRRQICKIAQTAGISESRAKLLFRIIRYFEPKNILEIGSSLGLATIAMSVASKNGNIISLEGCPETAKNCKIQLQSFDVQNVELRTTKFENYFKSPDFSRKNFDFVYFDGNHSESATMEYFNYLLPTITNNTIWIFDDIHWSNGMTNAWNIIKKHPKVTVTIDTFQWGIVFFRIEQAKQNFVVRT